MKGKDINYNDGVHLLRPPALWPTAKKYSDGDHWQDGNGWAAPDMFDIFPTESAGGVNRRARAKQVIERAMCSVSVIRDVTHDHRDGAIGHKPRVSCTVKGADDELTEEQQQRCDESDEIIKQWQKERSAIRVLGKAAEYALLSEAPGLLRTFLPYGHFTDAELEANEDGSRTLNIPAVPLMEAWEAIHFEAVTPDKGTIHKDASSGGNVSIFAGRFDKDVYSTGEDTDYLEISYVNEQKETVLRFVPRGETKATELAIDLGKCLWMEPIDAEALITEPIIRQQKALDLTYTMLQQNSVNGGYVMTLVMNGLLPGEKDPTTNEHVPDAIPGGANIVVPIMGVVQKDSDGRETFTTPSAVRLPASDVAIFERAIYQHRFAILEPTNLLVKLMGDDAAASGVSRVQARADFLRSLRRLGQAVARAYERTLKKVLRLSAYLSGNPGYFDDIEITVQCLLDAGPLLPDEMTEIRNWVKDRLISPKTAMELFGIHDAEVEMDLIRASQEGVEYALAQAEVVQAWKNIDYTLDLQAIAELAGMDVDEVVRILKQNASRGGTGDGQLGPEPVVVPANGQGSGAIQR